jgi:hypothetical protein
VQVDRDILNYAGATLSSQALARGVRKALVLFDYFYGANQKAASTGSPPLSHGTPLTSSRVILSEANLSSRSTGRRCLRAKHDS